MGWEVEAHLAQVHPESRYKPHGCKVALFSVFALDTYPILM